MRSLSRISSILPLTCLCLVPFLQADDMPATEQIDTVEVLEVPKYWVNVGVFYAGFDTQARLDASEFEIGTSIDLEDDIGMDKQAAFFDAQIGMYLSDRWWIEAEYMDLDRSTVARSETDIIWGDEVIKANSFVKSQFDLTIIRFLVGYDFKVDKRYRVGGTFGTHFVRMFAGIQGVLEAEGPPGSLDGFQADFEFEASAISSEKLPIPNIGVYGHYQLAERWKLIGRMDLFKLKFGEWGGELFTIATEARYINPNGWSIGAGLQFLLVNVDYQTDDWRGRVEYRHFGPKLDFGYLW
jgi:hypothetical protein